MNNLLLQTSFPPPVSDMTLAKAQIEATGEMPLPDGIAPELVHDIHMCYVCYLATHDRNDEALALAASLTSDENAEMMPPLHSAWLWLTQMSVMIEHQDYNQALNAAENTLTTLSGVIGRRSEAFLSIVAALLFNLARLHHETGDSSKAAKELIKAQQLFERLVKKNEAKFSALLILSVEASTSIIKSRQQQLDVFAQYQSMTELYTNMLQNGEDADKTADALNCLVDSLANEGEIMLQMGNGRNAVKYYTRALRYQKKISKTMGLKELQLSLGLARGLMKLINRRAAAEQLLTSLLPLARQLNASREEKIISDLLNNKNKNFNIMNLLKTIFTSVLITICALSANAQLVIGHRGSIWGVENTEAAFINGARAGAWGLECDIHLTADGSFIVCHDASTKRIGGTEERLGSINFDRAISIPLSQKRRGITYVGHLISLGRFLDICNEYKVVPVVEIKYTDCATIHAEDEPADTDNFTGVASLVSLLKSKGLDSTAVIISFMPRVIEYIHNNYPYINVQVLAGDGDISNWVKWCTKRGIDLDATHSLLSKEAIDTLHKAGLKVNAWTVDNPEVFARLADWGVDFITTNAIFPNELK